MEGSSVSCRIVGEEEFVLGHSRFFESPAECKHMYVRYYFTISTPSAAGVAALLSFIIHWLPLCI